MSDESKQTGKVPSSGAIPAADDHPSGSRVSLVEWTDEESSTRMTEQAIVLPPPAQPKQKTRALITVISGPNAGRTFTVRDGETVFGRAKDAHIRLDEGGVSRRHARVVSLEDGRHVLEDLTSTNGTFVDGKRIQRVELKSGDRIHLGPHVIVSFAVLDAQAERMAHQLYESSVRDTLTRAYNRRYLIERLASEIAYARRHNSPLALLIFDLDHFKRVNDTHGHLAGDDVLREVSALISRMIRVEDVFARFGGEEFVVLVRGIEQPNIVRFAERLRIGIERLEIASESTVLHVTVSIGCASLDELSDDQRTPEGLLRLADDRLYRAKESGRNRVCGA